jgi:UDP-glucuronate 4-epimerase
LFGDGSSRRDYTYIDDIVAGTLASCERVQPGEFNIYNLGGTRTTSLAELISCIENIVGKSALIHRMPDQPGDVPITCADISRAGKALGYKPTTDLATGIRHFWSWFQSVRK